MVPQFMRFGDIYYSTIKWQFKKLGKFDYVADILLTKPAALLQVEI